MTRPDILPRVRTRRTTPSSPQERPSSTPVMRVLCRHEASGYTPVGREVCISIHGADRSELRVSRRFASVLWLLFEDIDRPSPDPGDVLFAPEHARKIIDFIRGCGDVDAIVIHCEMGLSRSPGVALGLCDLFGWPVEPLEREYPLWNRWVRAELVRVGREMMGASKDKPQRRATARRRA